MKPSPNPSYNSQDAQNDRDHPQSGGHPSQVTSVNRKGMNIDREDQRTFENERAGNDNPGVNQSRDNAVHRNPPADNTRREVPFEDDTPGADEEKAETEKKVSTLDKTHS